MKQYIVLSRNFMLLIVLKETKEPAMFSSKVLRRAIEMKALFLQCHTFFHTLSITEIQGKCTNLYDEHSENISNSFYCIIMIFPTTVHNILQVQCHHNRVQIMICSCRMQCVSCRICKRICCATCFSSSVRRTFLCKKIATG